MAGYLVNWNWISATSLLYNMLLLYTNFMPNVICILSPQHSVVIYATGYWRKEEVECGYTLSSDVKTISIFKRLNLDLTFANFTAQKA